jgi:transposase
MEELRLELLREPERTGDSVAEVCRRRGVSRETFYVYRRRYLAEGVAGLTPRSRRPRFSPARVEPELEATICALRKRHPRWGARRLRAELARAGTEPPAVSTIQQALKRNGLVPPQPPRRRRADKRFEREVCNDLWQIDATEVALASGTKAWVLDCLDDHARFLLAALAVASPSGEARRVRKFGRADLQGSPGCWKTGQRPWRKPAAVANARVAPPRPTISPGADGGSENPVHRFPPLRHRGTNEK